jgi:hypothetical protein
MTPREISIKRSQASGPSQSMPTRRETAPKITPTLQAGFGVLPDLGNQLPCGVEILFGVDLGGFEFLVPQNGLGNVEAVAT